MQKLYYHVTLNLTSVAIHISYSIFHKVDKTCFEKFLTKTYLNKRI